ncbi:hypothetical protein MOQ_001302 [Trypanosoma cruzi marinkellei]|uniref:Uncharacterized protein n=1 Tax=Trypanosoma cruzi marinkellei TaxID=85056 RepID=K2NL52_TRYCR|nr:hypothetical protein MOQ_001302 [Trypanosoma cruzi marinkellei]
MPLVTGGKPSTKFRVVLAHNSLSDPCLGVSCSNSVHPADGPQRDVPCRPAITVNLANLKSDVKHAADSSQRGRYGGAIVRVSELQRSGGTLPTFFPSFEEPCGNEGNVRKKKPPATKVWHAVGMTNAKRENVSSVPDDTVATTIPAQGAVGGGNGRRCMPTRRGKRRAGGRSKNSRATPRSKIEQMREKSNSLQLKPNGEPYEHRWSTVNGRRQLHYGGRTYKGRAAHQLWSRIKTALSSTGPTFSHGNSIERNMKVTKGKIREHVRTGLVGAADTFSTGCTVTNSVTTNPRMSMSAPRPTFVSTARAKLLLDDDEEESLQKTGASADVVFVSEDDEETVISPGTSEISSLTSFGSDNDKLAGSESFLGSTSSFSTDDGYPPGSNFTTASVTSQKVDSSAGRKPPALVEHEGWLYPAELLPVLCEQRSCATSFAHKEAGNARTRGNGTAGRSSCLESEDNNLEIRPKVKGLTFLGSGDVADVSLSLHRRRDDASTTPISAYPLRYEEMDALDDFLEVVGEDLFVAGDEIGGMRFAP